jgi:hypothetical protein
MFRTTAATFAVLGLGLVTTAARAEVIGTVPLGPSGLSGSLPAADDACGHTFTWKLDMRAGRFYVVRAYFDRYGTATLRATGGTKIASFGVTPAFDDNFTGHEAKAPRTGTYLLDITSSPGPGEEDCAGDGEFYRISYLYDCPGGRGTDCVLPVGTTRRSTVDVLK